MNLKDKIKSLIDILKQSDIDEIEISSFWGAQKIRVSNKKEYYNNLLAPNTNKEVLSEINPLPNNNQKEDNNMPRNNDNIEDISNNSIIIKAPLVGTYYSSPKPDTPSFINVGDKIQKGQVICIIEAMKIFNEIESDHSGTIVEILIENGTPVEFDQDLVIIK